MNDKTIQQKDDRRLSMRELADRWGVSLVLLRKRSKAGEGPAYNSAIRGYMLSDIIEFEGGGLVARDALAARWGIGLRALEKRAVQGTAPAKVKIGNRTFYRMNDIIKIEQTRA